MLLPTINPDVLKRYLKAPEEKGAFAKLKSLSTEAIASLQKGLAYSKQLENCVGSTGKTTASYRQEMLESATQLDTTKFHELTNSYCEDISKANRLDWNKKQCNTLSKKETWEQLSRACKGKEKEIEALYHQWMRQQRYATYSSDALMKLSLHVFPLFENYLDMLITELNYYKKRLPVEIKKALQNYVTVLSEEIRKEKECIAYSMSMRLKVASDSISLTDDDVIVYFATKLKQLGALQENYRPPIKQQGLDKDKLQYFQHFLLQWGSKSQIK